MSAVVSHVSPMPDNRITLMATALEDAETALGYEAALPYLLALRKPVDSDAGQLPVASPME